MSSSYNQDKIVYRTLSVFAATKLLIARLVLVAVIISAIIHFNENPIVISIVVTLLSIMLLYVGNENIIVYEHKFVYQYGSLLKAWTWGKTYYYRDVEQVNCEGIFTKGLDVITNRLPVAVDPYNKIDIVFKDGKSDEIRSRIYKQELKKAIEEIVTQLNKAKKRETAHNTSLAKKRL